jgi:hypothetical protein
MGHPLCAHPDPRNPVLEHVASGRQVGRHDRRVAAAQVEDGARRRQVQASWIVDTDRTGGIRLVGPVAVRVEVLHPVQGSTEPLDRPALGSLFVLGQLAVDVELHLGGDDAPVAVEQVAGRVDRFPEATAQVAHATAETRDRLVKGTWIAVDEKIGIIAVCGRVGNLGEIRRSDGAEPSPVAGELVRRSRLEAGAG